MSPHDLPLPLTAGSSGAVTLTLVPDNWGQISDAIELLIGMLDALEPDPDLECGGDLEPTLGWTGEGRGVHALIDGIPYDADLESDLGVPVTFTDAGPQFELEADDCDREPSGDELDYNGDELDFDGGENDAPGHIWGGQQ